MKLKKIPQKFFNRNTIEVAKDLLGKYLVHTRSGVTYIGKVVETEAYLGAHDLAAHSARGLTERNKVMFGPAGFAYVYLIYGIYYCFNVVTEKEGHPSAVLIRAVEPIENIDMRTQGPGLLCKAMHIDKRLTGKDMQSDEFYFAYPPKKETITIIKKKRIGVDYAGHWAKRLLRFYIQNNSFISKK